MPNNIQVVATEKSRWDDGLLAFIAKDGSLLGSDTLIAEIHDLSSASIQFAQAPANEVIAYVNSGKKPRTAAWFSTKQVKYYTAQDKLRILAGRSVRVARKLKLDRITLPLENASPEEISAVVQGLQTSAYTYDKYKTTVDVAKTISVSLLVEKSNVSSVQKLVKEEATLSSGIALARNLVNEIPAELYPERLAETAQKAVSLAGSKVTVYDEKRLSKERFNGVVTVGRGSNRPPRLVLMKHTPAKKSPIHLCLVGKAVTFDTGGHSLKPSKAMWEMKGDMAGGAAVIGAMEVISKLKPSIQVTGIVPSALNAIGPNAVLPGDIIRSRSGKTVHVDNTDAEGRLLLMDALDLARELGATHIIDVATLTGSIVRALGHAMAGLFANDDDWAQEILQSGSIVGEGFWHMPLIAEYRELLDHPVADVDNVSQGLNAGSITAGLFLQEFVPDSIKWAHLDIAAMGLITKNYKCFAPGATGFGVRTLVEVAQRLATQSGK